MQPYSAKVNMNLELQIVDLVKKKKKHVHEALEFILVSFNSINFSSLSV